MGSGWARPARRGSPHTIWLADTDADSVVPSDWLICQIYLANRGADVIVGGVPPNEAELDEERCHAWQLTHLDGQAHGHVHGANFGIRANLYTPWEVSHRSWSMRMSTS